MNDKYKPLTIEDVCRGDLLHDKFQEEIVRRFNSHHALTTALREIVSCDYHDEIHDPETLCQLIEACEDAEELLSKLEAPAPTDED